MGRSMEERFWPRVEKEGPIHPTLGTRCWLWCGAKGDDGYGLIRDENRKTTRVTRYAWTLSGRPIPKGHFVLHHCDERLCVNYEQHLFTGTHKDNMDDMYLKGRGPTGLRNGRFTKPERTARGLRNGAYTKPENRPHGDRHGSKTKPERVPRGERNGHAKLTDDVVREMRRSYALGKTSSVRLARRYGVAKHTILMALKRRTWAHVD